MYILVENYITTFFLLSMKKQHISMFTTLKDHSSLSIAHVRGWRGMDVLVASGTASLLHVSQL